MVKSKKSRNRNYMRIRYKQSGRGDDTYYMSIPKHMINSLDWKVGDKIYLTPYQPSHIHLSNQNRALRKDEESYKKTIKKKQKESEKE